MTKESLSKELSALGSDLVKALGKIKNSSELQKLEKDLVKGFKSVSQSVAKALKAAHDSPSAASLNRRLKRVVKLGKKEGGIQAKKAAAVAAKQIKKARKAVSRMSQKEKQKGGPAD